MSDHGLFIAGVIHDFVPDADIYLVEVLNNYGVGTIETLVEGFRALSEQRISPLDELSKDCGALIVNCSLCMECPAPNDKGEIVLPFHDSQGNVLYTLTFKSAAHLFEPLHAALELFYRQFEKCDVQIVAAAGNKGLPPQKVANMKNYIPPAATYPAAFDSVLGVGAMETANRRAWYSNLADVQPYDGVIVFGGMGIYQSPPQAATNGVKEWSESHSTVGMLGVYVGEFPPIPNPQTGEVKATAQLSSNGWGRWSGTSFATGVMSGILARAAGKGCTISLRKPGNFYQHLHTDVLTRRTQYGEVIIRALQSQPNLLVRLWRWFLYALGRAPKP